MNEFNSLERKAGLLSMQGLQTASIHAAMFMQVLAAHDAGNEKLVKTYVSDFRPTCAKPTTRGWRRSLSQIRMPIRIRSCRGFMKCAERKKPRKRLRPRPRA